MTRKWNPCHADDTKSGAYTRRRRPGLRWLHADPDALAYLRETSDESVLVLARRSSGGAITLPIDSPLTSLTDAPDLTPADGHVTLPAGDAGLSIWTTASGQRPSS